MNHIFHYYVTYFVALKAGFSHSDAHIVAYSAQYVDHSLVPYQIKYQSGKTYRIAVTHHFGFWDRRQEREIWMPFHFFPGGISQAEYAGGKNHDLNARRDETFSPKIVIPHSKPAKEVLTAALKSRNLYRIGIALHTWADTWAHQNFTGTRDDLNEVPGSLPLPSIGHAQAEYFPDVFSISWSDSRLVNTHIDNHVRFIEAARSMYKYLRTYLGLPYVDIDTMSEELETLVGPVRPPEAAVHVHQSLAQRIRKGIQQAQSFVSPDKSGNGFLPVRIGPTDEEIELNFQIAFPALRYDRAEWRREAFGNGYMQAGDSAENVNMNDKSAWLAHQIFAGTGLAQKEIQPAVNFESSNLYQWSEAAYEHFRVADEVIRQIL